MLFGAVGCCWVLLGAVDVDGCRLILLDAVGCSWMFWNM